MKTSRYKPGESVFYDFYPEDGDVIVADMTGRYELLDSTGSIATSGSMTKSGTNREFEMRIQDATTAAFDGRYKLEVYTEISAEGYSNIIYEEYVVFE